MRCHRYISWRQMACAALFGIGMTFFSLAHGRLSWGAASAKACGLTFAATMLANQEPALAYPVAPGSSIGATAGIFALDYGAQQPVQFTEDIARLPSPLDPSTFIWRWDFGDGDQATGYTIVHAFAQPGLYTVRVQVQSIQDQSFLPSDFDSAQIRIVPAILDHLPVAVASSTARYVQVGDSVTYDAGGSHALIGDTLSYTWNFGDATVATGPHVTHHFQAIGDGFVALIVQDRRGARSYVQVPVTIVAQLPQARVATSARQGEAGSPISFDATGSTAPTARPYNRIVSYHWDFGDGAHAMTLTTHVTHVYAKGGHYTVTVQAIDRQALPGTASLRIVISDMHQLGLPSLLVLALPLLSIILIAGLVIVVIVHVCRHLRRA